MFKHILLASHGSEGAVKAEDMALQVCARSGTIEHLIVIPEFWQHMTGDDWLNNGVTRDRFRDYLQTELGREIDQQCDRLRQKVSASSLQYQKLILFGKPDQALLDCESKRTYDLIVLGSPRPPGISGLTSLRSKMLTKAVIQTMHTAVLIAPYPE